jgi:hypothetical protein
MLNIRNRVKELRLIKGSELLKNAKNYRVHTQAQRDTMRGVLEEVGIVGALLARETKDGIELIDGEMRSDMLPEEMVPVLMTDLTDSEVDTVLATLDPITTMAKHHDQRIGSLLQRIQTENADIRRLLTDLRPKERSNAKEAEREFNHEVPGMALEPHEHYDYLVVLCSTTHEWNVLCELLDILPTQRRGTMGTARAIRASKLLTKLQERS